jgi:DNA invertase Pin-like site-specific DNA recombinase
VTPAPTPEAAPTVGDDLSVTWLIAGLLILLALVLGALTSLVVPELRRLWKVPASPAAKPAPALPQPKPAPAPAAALAPRRPQAQSRPAPRVLGYATVNGQDQGRDTATASVALLCNYRGWSLLEVVHDHRDPARSLTDRPGLMYAVNALRGGEPSGLVVAHLRDFTNRIADLATLLKWLDEADAFLGAADHELDTSTRAGKSTAAAIIELGLWERRRIADRTRADLVRGRFTPNGGPTDVEIAHQIAAMNGRGLSLRAIADALNIAGIPGPYGHSRWQPTHVKAATEERNRA